MRITDNNYYTEHSIRTNSGLVFDLNLLKPESISIEDIAHGLAHTPRFAGHLDVFFSVAQHSVLVANYVRKENMLGALLHDASEAYIGDMPSPFKKLMPDYKRIETNIMEAVAKKFGFEFPLNKDIKTADGSLLSLEWEAFVNKTITIEVWTPKEAKAVFLETFKSLNNGA